MKTVSIRQITEDNANTSISYAGMGVNILTPSGKLLKHGQSKSKVFQNPVCFTQISWNILAVQEMVSFYLKRLTSLTPIPNIAFKTINFYST